LWTEGEGNKYNNQNQAPAKWSRFRLTKPVGRKRFLSETGPRESDGRWGAAEAKGGHTARGIRMFDKTYPGNQHTKRKAVIGCNKVSEQKAL